MVFPERIHDVHTRVARALPPVKTLTRCKLGIFHVLVMPVVFLPTPPSRLALPLCTTLFPVMGFLPQIAHTFATVHLSLGPDPKRYFSTFTRR